MRKTGILPRLFVLVVLMTLSMVFVLVGCTSSNSVNQPSSDASEQPTQNTADNNSTAEKSFNYNLLMPSGSSGGGRYLSSAAVADLLNAEIPGLSITVTTTSGTVDDLKKMQQGKGDIMVTSFRDAYLLFQGEGIEKPLDNIRLLTSIYPMYGYVFVPKNSEAESFEDLIGKKVDFGARGGGVYTMNEDIMKGLGLSFEDFDATYLGVGEALDAFADGSVEGVFLPGLPQPFARFEDFNNSPRGIKFLPFTQQQIDKIIEITPWWSSGAITKEVYPWLQEDILTPSIWMVMIVKEDLPEDLVYEMIRVLDEQHDRLVTGYAPLESATIENTLKMNGIPLHHDPAKYIEETE